MEAESASASTLVVVPLPVGRLGRVVFPNRMRLARTSNADRSSVIYGSSPQGSSFGSLRSDFTVVYKSQSSATPFPPSTKSRLHRVVGSLAWHGVEIGA